MFYVVETTVLFGRPIAKLLMQHESIGEWNVHTMERGASFYIGVYTRLSAEDIRNFVWSKYKGIELNIHKE